MGFAEESHSIYMVKFSKLYFVVKITAICFMMAILYNYISFVEGN